MKPDPFTFIWPTIAIGGLAAYGQPLGQFGLILNTSVELAQYGDKNFEGHDIVHTRLIDDDENADIEEQVPEIFRAVAFLRQHLSKPNARPALVTCGEGRNRSALVVAEYALSVSWFSKATDQKWFVDEMVEHIQRVRPNTLTNSSFVKWLKRERRPVWI